MAIIWKVVQSLSGEHTGRDCRRCHEPIREQDSVGMSEGVRRPWCPTRAADDASA